MKNHKVLFVDDEPNVTAGLQRSFRREPYEFLSATSAREGLELLAQQEVDVVVSDEQMPEMSGSEFLSEVCRLYPQTIRMILTGQASLEAAIRAINEGQVYRFFTKPCNEVDLKHTIRNALRQKELERQSRRLLKEYRRQAAVIEELERQTPGIAEVHTDESGAILLENVGDMQDLLTEIEQEIGESVKMTQV